MTNTQTQFERFDKRFLETIFGYLGVSPEQLDLVQRIGEIPELDVIGFNETSPFDFKYTHLPGSLSSFPTSRLALSAFIPDEYYSEEGVDKLLRKYGLSEHYRPLGSHDPAIKLVNTEVSLPDRIFRKEGSTMKDERVESNNPNRRMSSYIIVYLSGDSTHVSTQEVNILLYNKNQEVK